MIFKVLIIDDDYINRRLLVSLLQKTLYQIEIIESIEVTDALQQCKKHSDIQLILLDVEMPNRDGADFLKHHFANNPLPNTPIIAVSSNDLRIKEILSLGASTFIVKPISEKKLLDGIKKSQKK